MPRGYGRGGLEGGHCRKDTAAADWREAIAARIWPRRAGILDLSDWSDKSDKSDESDKSDS